MPGRGGGQQVIPGLAGGLQDQVVEAAGGERRRRALAQESRNVSRCATIGVVSTAGIVEWYNA